LHNLCACLSAVQAAQAGLILNENPQKSTVPHIFGVGCYAAGLILFDVGRSTFDVHLGSGLSGSG